MYRIYIVQAGGLIKNSNLDREHRFPTLPTAVIYIHHCKQLNNASKAMNRMGKRFKSSQVVIQKYTDKFEAKIVRIINPEDHG